MQDAKSDGHFRSGQGADAGNQESCPHAVYASAQIVSGQQAADAGDEHKQSREYIADKIHRTGVKKGNRQELGMN